MDANAFLSLLNVFTAAADEAPPPASVGVLGRTEASRVLLQRTTHRVWERGVHRNQYGHHILNIVLPSAPVLRGRGAACDVGE